jgi:hypothetical protein
MDSNVDLVVDTPQEPKPPEFYLSQVHGGRMGHHGVVRTWQLLTKYFVGHRIPYATVRDYVASCSVC